jgi:signal transduction histidine kinase
MAPSINSESVSELSDVDSTLHLLAAAPDQQSFFATLRRALPRLLPGTRVDIIGSHVEGSESVHFTSGAHPPPPMAVIGTDLRLRSWLEGQGYRVLEMLPLTGTGERCGSLLLSRKRGGRPSASRAVARQLAPLIALRLRYDQAQRELSACTSKIALLEEQLRETQTLRVKALLAAGAAHNIRNLFTAVLGYAQLLQLEAPELMQPDLALIIQAAKDGQQILRRLQSPQARPATAAAESLTLVSTIIQDSIKLTQTSWDPEAPITVETVLEDNLVVRAPAVELREVLVNLILNAVAAMPDGGTLMIRGFTHAGQVIIEVNDTGQGIAREYQSTIFQPFITTHATGSGLGLSVSRAIIERYNGTLTVRSTLAQGATFTLTLPTITDASL